FISIADELYDENRCTPGFIKEYIFPGGSLPSFSWVIASMAAASRLSKIVAMGFDENFIRTWEYYFDYCAAGFKSYMLGDYQVVFSRRGNVGTLGDPYKGFPSVHNAW
ncbi:hypothetical protein Tsubulata_021575, partial [Turnera subulata]